MVQARIQFAQIGGYQPAADYRKAGVVGVIEGRNFSWDAAGVRADFASRLIATGTSLGSEGYAAEEIDVDNGYYLSVDTAIWRFTPASAGSPVGTWSNDATLTRVQQTDLSLVPDKYRGFTSAFLGGYGYCCSWNHGVYRIDTSAHTFTRLTSVNTSGFPADSEPVIAICETNGRLCYLTKTTFYWSGPNAPESLTPSLGGPGFQTLAEKVGGDPRAITAIATGAIVWTDSGALVCEFIGGDAVFRFYEMQADYQPLSQTAIVRLAAGTHVMLTPLGLYQVESAGTPKPLVPLFNEFLREYLRTRTVELANMWYSLADNRLYVAMRRPNGVFGETFVLDIGLDKWGVLNDQHLGMFHYAPERSPFAIMHPSGVTSYFLSVHNTLKDKENPANPGNMMGLGSYVTLGYIRSEELATAADSVQELNEVNIYRSNPLYDANMGYEDEGSVAAASPTTVDEGHVTDSSPAEFDEGSVVAEEPPHEYDLSLLGDLFSQTASLTRDLSRSPMKRVHQGPFSDLWVGGIPSLHFRLRFGADNLGEFFRINAVDCTVTSVGQFR